MTVIELEAYRRVVRARRLGDIAPAVADILHVLVESGGALHRREVAQRLAERRGIFSREGRDAVEAEVFGAFDRYMQFAAGKRQAPLMHLPFGPGSYRWAVTEAGRRLLTEAGERRAARS